MPGPTGSQRGTTELVGDPEAGDVGSGATRGAVGGATAGALAGGLIGAIPGAIVGAAIGGATEAAEPEDLAEQEAPGARAASGPAVERVVRTQHGTTERVARHPNPTDR